MKRAADPGDPDFGVRSWVVLHVRKFAWWLLQWSCVLNGGHTFIDRLQQACHCCGWDYMHGRAGWISTKALRFFGTRQRKDPWIVATRDGGLKP